jgi:Domain of unknown function (DUF4192)
MTTIVKAAGAAEFLSLVPRMLGYVPSLSLVMIPFAGSRSIGAMRFDLPEGDPDAVDRVAATVIGMVCRLADADAVAAIVYTDAGFADAEGMPHAELFDAIERRAHACGLRLTDALCVGADGWGSLLDRSKTSIPAMTASTDRLPLKAISRPAPDCRRSTLPPPSASRAR